MNLLGMGKREYRTQLLFHDDNSFEFRVLPIQEAALVEYKQDRIVRAYPIFNRLTKTFPGYKRLKACRLMLCYVRDIILDPYREVDTSGNGAEPEIEGETVKDWIRSRAEATVYRVQNMKRKITAMERLTLYGFIIAVLMALAIVISVVTG